MNASLWHHMPTKEVLQTLQTKKQGLTEEEANRRLSEFGYNELKERKKVTALQIFLGQFKDIFVIMLLVAILISGLTREITDAITISAIVILNAVVGFIQEYRSEKALEAMKRLTAPKAKLIRDGREVIIPAKEVVPGDVAILESGDSIPADARLMEAVNLKTDEAVLTGESIPVTKDTSVTRVDAPLTDRKNMVFMSTHVTYGRGKAVITSTGMNTEFGKIAEMVQAAPEMETPLKLKLGHFAKRLAIIVTVVCALIFLLEGLRGELLLESFMIAVALAVSAVPEGLPAIVTVTLALGARELAKRNALIRRLSSVETLGATTVICSDKTGTLTKGEMTVRELYTNGQITEVTGVGYEPTGEFHSSELTANPIDDPNLALLLRIGVLCNDAKLVKDEKWHIIGDSTEGALIVTATKAGMLQEKMERAYPRIGEIPFSSERKLMTTIHSTPDGERLAYVKGAPEVVLARCTYVYKNDKVERLSKKERNKILKTNEKMAEEALRILGMAYRRLPDNLTDFTEENVENNLTFVGLMGMIDPPREEAKEANRLCQKAGIRAVMITGDHKLTAMAVARDLGIVKSGLVLTGAELDRMSDEELEGAVKETAVYARVSPQHKLRIVKALKKNGEIVAMTGDGVNDAPALKHADIGVAMGITGTDVSREASDMVLADDNFATIVNAVNGGRIIYDNIRKFAFYLMRCNFDELLVIATFALMNIPVPFLPAMILWLNLVTDGGPALALSMDPPTEDVMQRPPRNPKEGILHGKLASIITSFTMQYLGTIFIFWLIYYEFGASLDKARTMAFMQATMRELVIVWNCRSEKHNAFKVGFRSNRFLLIAVIGSLFLTASLCYIPVLSSLFHVVPLGITDWILISMVACSGLLLMPEILANRKILRWM